MSRERLCNAVMTKTLGESGVEEQPRKRRRISSDESPTPARKRFKNSDEHLLVARESLDARLASMTSGGPPPVAVADILENFGPIDSNFMCMLGGFQLALFFGSAPENSLKIVRSLQKAPLGLRLT
jgi:hypothetical protein